MDEVRVILYRLGRLVRRPTTGGAHGKDGMAHEECTILLTEIDWRECGEKHLCMNNKR
jgi:hypothetical protein